MSTDLRTNISASDENIISHRTTININQHLSTQNIVINGSSLSLNSKTPRFESNVVDLGDVETTDGVDSPTEERKKIHEPAEIDESNVDFSLNREQWQKRANSHSNIKISQTLKANRNSENWLQRQNHTPDLVMDLPLVGNPTLKDSAKKSISVSGNLYAENSSEEDSTSVKSLENAGPESPDMTTAAERFAKQNQCTLKKNMKVHIDSAGKNELTKPVTDLIAITSPTPERKYAPSTNATTTTFKPQIKTKPPVFKKPAFAVPLPIAILPTDAKKDAEDLST